MASGGHQHRFHSGTGLESEDAVPSFTLKGLPDDLYDALKRRAAVHRRSLNGEILYMLERAVARESTPATDDVLARIDALRARLAAEGVRLDPALVEQARRDGRP
jgi:plasmid stability protein